MIKLIPLGGSQCRYVRKSPQKPTLIARLSLLVKKVVRYV